MIRPRTTYIYALATINPNGVNTSHSMPFYKPITFCPFQYYKHICHKLLALCASVVRSAPARPAVLIYKEPNYQAPSGHTTIFILYNFYIYYIIHAAFEVADVRI